MIRLVLPSRELAASWVEAASDFDDVDDQPDGFALIDVTATQLHDPEVLDRWLARTVTMRTQSVGHLVPATTWWIIDDAAPDEVLGSIDLRHELNDFLFAHAGHIGYGVRRSARRRGVASAALRLVLAEAAALGITRVLITCNESNIASAATIRGAGGMFEATAEGSHRFWIDVLPVR